MTVKDLEGLYDYGYWANGKLFDVISQLTPEQFAQPVAGSYGSIRNTLAHILSAEAGWLWHTVEAHVREFLATLKDEDLTRNVEFAIGGAEKRSMPLGELMQHAANHGVHHRGQVALLLRLVGYTPGNFDILFYFRDKHDSWS